MLNIENLTKRYGNTEVLKSVSLKVEKGEIVVVLGPSGGGKTTLLKIINGLETCDGGDISFNGQYICEKGQYKPKEDIKKISKDIGMVFQGFNLFPHMSVLENIIEAPIRVQRKSKEEAVKNAREILSFLALDQKESDFPYQLSGGQSQRVAIGRALALEPKLICFDEPTSALDPTLTSEVAKLIKSLSKKGISMLIITHDMEFAKQVSDRIISMENGEIVDRNIYFD